MKKGRIVSLIIVVAVIVGISVVSGYEYYKKTDGNKMNSIQASKVPVEEITVTKILNSKEVIVNVTGNKNINKIMIAKVLELNGITGVNVDIKINSEAYGGVNGSEVLKACAKKLNIKVTAEDCKLANILVATSTGLDMLDTHENVYKVINLTNEHFEDHYSNQGLFMGVPDRILNKYSPKIKNDDGADSLYVQMCIFLNQYYTNLNNTNSTSSSDNTNN